MTGTQPRFSVVEAASEPVNCRRGLVGRRGDINLTVVGVLMWHMSMGSNKQMDVSCVQVKKKGALRNAEENRMRSGNQPCGGLAYPGCLWNNCLKLGSI